MPCDSSYLEPTWSEKEASKLLAIASEVLDGSKVNPKTFGNGMFAGDYARLKDRDSLVRSLCERLKLTDPTSYSLEVQIWWRDHLKADREREDSLKGKNI